MTSNVVAYLRQQEDARHNLATETETARNNQVVARETNRHNFAVETETNRSNLANEAETNRANLAREAENLRSNLAREKETHRSNRANEKETKRSNKARENWQNRSLDETIRHNLSTESLTDKKIESDKSIAAGHDAAQIASSSIAANATITAASIAAGASRYAAQLAAYAKQLDIQQRAADNSANRKTQKQIAKAKNLSNEMIAMQQLLEQARQANNKDAIARAQNKINAQRNAIQEAFNKHQINRDQYDRLMDILRTIYVTTGG